MNIIYSSIVAVVLASCANASHNNSGTLAEGGDVVSPTATTLKKQTLDVELAFAFKTGSDTASLEDHVVILAHQLGANGTVISRLLHISDIYGSLETAFEHGSLLRSEDQGVVRFESQQGAGHHGTGFVLEIDTAGGVTFGGADQQFNVQMLDLDNFFADTQLSAKFASAAADFDAPKLSSTHLAISGDQGAYWAKIIDRRADPLGTMAPGLWLLSLDEEVTATKIVSTQIGPFISTFDLEDGTQIFLNEEQHSLSALILPNGNRQSINILTNNEAKTLDADILARSVELRRAN